MTDAPMTEVSVDGKLVTNRLSPAIRATPIGSSASQPENPPTADGRRGVVTAEDVVEVGSRVGFDLLPAVAVDDYLDRDPDAVAG